MQLHCRESTALFVIYLLPLYLKDGDRRSVLFLAVLDPRLATPWTYFLRLSLSSVILTDSTTGSPVHVLMLSIQAVRGLPRLRAPGIVPCIISFSRQLIA